MLHWAVGVSDVYLQVERVLNVDEVRVEVGGPLALKDEHTEHREQNVKGA